MSGVGQSFSVAATFYTVAGKTYRFGLRNDTPNNDLISVNIERRIGKPATVSIVFPGLTAPHGEQWSDLLLGAWVKLEAVVQRIPDQLSDPWRTVFFGFGRYVQSGFQAGSEFSNTSMFVATDQLGFLETALANYWEGLPGTFGGALGEPSVAVLDASLTAQLQKTDFFASTAVLAKNIFDGFFYPFAPTQRKIDNDTILWKNTHGFNFESDDFVIPVTQAQFAPEAQSWLAALTGAIDAPAFYELFCEMQPTSIERSRTENNGNAAKVYKKPPLLFTGKDNIVRGDHIVIRPHPFPKYIDGQYDERAWSQLNTIFAREEVGEHQTNSTRSTDNVFTYYNTRSSIPNGDPTLVGDALQGSIFDQSKWLNLTMYNPMTPTTRREPTRVTTQKLQNGTYVSSDQQAATGGDWTGFLNLLNQQLFSRHQFNDRFETVELVSPIDLRLELGSRYVYGFSPKNKGKMGYVEGYTHNFTVESATSAVSMTRVLPVDTYEGEYRQTLGRKRRDEPLGPIHGADNIYSKTLELRRKRGL